MRVRGLEKGTRIPHTPPDETKVHVQLRLLPGCASKAWPHLPQMLVPSLPPSADGVHGNEYVQAVAGFKRSIGYAADLRALGQKSLIGSGKNYRGMRMLWLLLGSWGGLYAYVVFRRRSILPRSCKQPNGKPASNNFGLVGFRSFTPITEKQLFKKMEHEVETGIRKRFVGRRLSKVKDPLRGP